MDLKAEVVTIVNQGDVSQDMTGWRLISEVGENQVFRFPPGFTLLPGASVQITSGSASVYPEDPPGILQWRNVDGSIRKSNIWNDAGDPALLFNAAGERVSSYP